MYLPVIPLENHLIFFIDFNRGWSIKLFAWNLISIGQIITFKITTFESVRYSFWDYPRNKRHFILYNIKIITINYYTSIFVDISLTLMDANSSVVSDESRSICSETAAPLGSLMFIRWYGDSGMQRTPIKCKITQKAQATQNGTYFKNAPDVYEYSMPMTMNNWNIVPRRPTDTYF